MFVKAYHVCGHGIFIGPNGISLTFGLKDKVWSKAQIIFWLAFLNKILLFGYMELDYPTIIKLYELNQLNNSTNLWYLLFPLQFRKLMKLKNNLFIFIGMYHQQYISFYLD